MRPCSGVPGVITVAVRDESFGSLLSRHGSGGTAAKFATSVRLELATKLNDGELVISSPSSVQFTKLNPGLAAARTVTTRPVGYVPLPASKPAMSSGGIKVIA